KPINYATKSHVNLLNLNFRLAKVELTIIIRLLLDRGATFCAAILFFMSEQMPVEVVSLGQW
ncbi:MAG: hypothetical protein K2L41_09335, partial [Muribaculaceae bacterium]|nr:hypothetical protein [Muribaculaceae bacterium]